MQPNDITFYQRFEADILAGRKTITIRDKSESHFKAGGILRVGRFECSTGEYEFGRVERSDSGYLSH